MNMIITEHYLNKKATLRADAIEFQLGVNMGGGRDQILYAVYHVALSLTV